MSHQVKKSKLKIASSIIFYVFIALLLVAIINVVVARARGKDPSFFGYSILYVKTGSMEPNIPAKSIILVKNISDDELNDLKINDVVVFRSEIYNAMTITHRIIETNFDEGYVVTQGDDNSVPDKNAQGEFKTELDRIVGVYVTKLDFISGCYNVLASGWGFLLIIIVPSIALLVGYVISIAKSSVLLKEEKDQEARVEQLKKEAIEEYLKNNQPKETENIDSNTEGNSSKE